MIEDAVTQQLYWLGLSLLMRNSPARAKQAVTVFGTPERVWQASLAELQTFGYTEPGAQRIVQERKKINLAQEMDRILRSGAQIITMGDAAYPPSLRALDDAPPLLYMRGTLRESDTLALAMVGTRSATRYGLDAAHYFALELARAGVTIISGLAQGIDTASHKGALEARGRTIALLGNGIDVMYPRENDRLAQQIIENGALLSEYPLGMPPMASNFPRRNRLISGLARAVLVVEAPEQSGALSTAHAALDQGRDVFAVPGLIFNPASIGANRLIQDGAKLVMSSADILEELGLEAESRPKVPRPTAKHPVSSVSPASTPAKPARDKPLRTVKPPSGQASSAVLVPDPDLVSLPQHEDVITAVNDLPDSERQVYERLSSVPTHIDEIIRDLNLSARDVSVSLTMLELKGLAENMGAMQYCHPRH